MTTASSAAGPGLSRDLERRAARAGLAGSVIEYYDFIVYAFLATTIAPQFFPHESKSAALLSTLAVFGAGYVARPLGAIFFGWLGDRHGRRVALLSTVTGMGLATCLLGVIPTYSQVGVLAPLLLMLIRLVQGFSAGGELIGAVTYVAESAPRERRGLFLSLTPFGAGVGTALAPAIVGLVTLLLEPAQVSSWGWRLPFLLSIPLVAVALVLRVGLEDSPEFRKLVERSEIVRFPLGTVVRKHWLPLIQVVLLAVVVNSTGFLTSTYMNIYLINDVGLSENSVFWFSAVVLLLAVGSYVVGGAAIDRFGTKRVLVCGLIGSCAVAYPVLAGMGAVHGIFLIGLIYLVLAIVNNVTLAPAYATFVGAFPGPVRYTGAALGFNIGTMIGAGFAPFFASLLATKTGNPVAPAFLVVGATLVGLVVVTTIRSLSRGGVHLHDDGATAAARTGSAR